jgi:hypothetical protein
LPSDIESQDFHDSRKDRQDRHSLATSLQCKLGHPESNIVGLPARNTAVREPHWVYCFQSNETIAEKSADYGTRLRGPGGLVVFTFRVGKAYDHFSDREAHVAAGFPQAPQDDGGGKDGAGAEDYCLEAGDNRAHGGTGAEGRLVKRGRRLGDMVFQRMSGMLGVKL